MSRSLRVEALDLLERVIDLDAGQRESVLAEKCRDRPELRALVDAMLRADEDPHALLDSGSEALLGLVEDDEPQTTPDHIGDYRLLRVAGSGGMATVYLAERDVGGIHQRVALKVLRRGFGSDDMVRRFAHEARLLASLEHPNIARFHDAGEAPDGRPYLVMEFVDGRPLTVHCDVERLGVDARIDLFRTACEAAQYAHQRFVVHRDIKPSNILVNTRGELKLLDFGIAKLLSPDAHDDGAPETRTGALLLTPEYAAPEQLQGEEVTAATDVYGLGIVLYELLTGRRPYGDGGRLDPAARLQAPADPIPPSTAVRRAIREGSAAETALTRGTTPERLCRNLSGDLDRILLKALDPDPSRRYPSAEQLLAELKRYRLGLPVLARPNTILYRVRKFTRRNRGGVAVAAAGLVLLTGLAVYHTARITAERDYAEAEAAKARTATRFLQRLLGDAYPSITRGEEFSIDELLERAVARIDSIPDQPDVQAELLRTIGDIYREQGRFGEAMPLLERAVALHRGSPDPRSREAGQALDALGHLHYQAGEYQAALASHSEAFSIFSERYEPDDSLVLFAMNNMAAANAALGAFGDAMRLYEDILRRRSRLFTDTSELVHVAYNNLGDLRSRMGDHEGSESAFREALRLRRFALPPDHPSTALTMNNLGTVLTNLGRLEEAEEIHRQAMDIFVRVFGPDHHRVGLSAYNLARVHRLSGRLAEAESLLAVTLRIDRVTYGEDHLEVGLDLRQLGEIQREAGDCEKASVTLTEADAIFETNNVPLSERRRLLLRANLGACLLDLGRTEEAEKVLIVSMSAAEADSTADPAAHRFLLEQVDSLYRFVGRHGDAEAVRQRLRDLSAKEPTE